MNFNSTTGCVARHTKSMSNLFRREEMNGGILISEEVNDLAFEVIVLISIKLA